MKKMKIATLGVIAGLLIASLFSFKNQPNAEYEYKTITVVESIVPAGIGRSRIIEQQQEVNVDDFTTERVNGKKSDQGKVKRKETRIEKFSETKLLNFYSAVGIQFRNIASNDAIISSKVNKMRCFSS